MAAWAGLSRWNICSRPGAEPRGICGCVTGTARGGCQVHQEQKVLLISTAASLSSKPDCYLN